MPSTTSMTQSPLCGADAFGEPALVDSTSKGLPPPDSGFDFWLLVDCEVRAEVVVEEDSADAASADDGVSVGAGTNVGAALDVCDDESVVVVDVVVDVVDSGVGLDWELELALDDDDDDDDELDVVLERPIDSVMVLRVAEVDDERGADVALLVVAPAHTPCTPWPCRKTPMMLSGGMPGTAPHADETDEASWFRPAMHDGLQVAPAAKSAAEQPAMGDV